MRIGVIQSSFIPWRGYFDFIASVDTFVFHDDIQYTKGDWRNRNKIKTAKGSEWLSVPVSYKSVSQLICDTPIDNSTPWAKKHLRIWQAHYQAAPFFSATKEILTLLNDKDDATISQLNIKLIRNICEYLGISTPMMLSSELALVGSKTERLIDLLKKLNATTYLSGPSADAYLDKEAFRRNGIQLEYKSYDYAPYPQLWGDFVGEVTVLDLIANCGPEARNQLRSRTPDTVVIPRITS
ncbi:MAG: hypothetical protein EBZ61_09120 [Micrococcales bacterium]|nr:hypothetical protein [Micrococcales bacterium]